MFARFCGLLFLPTENLVRGFVLPAREGGFGARSRITVESGNEGRLQKIKLIIGHELRGVFSKKVVV